MPRCPNCSYNLVFLEKRLRYECAKCGMGFLRKFVENGAFRAWNGQLRIFGMRELMSEIGLMEEEKQKKRELSEFNRIGKGLRFLFAGQGRKASASSEERRLREVEYNRKWRENNPEKVKILRRRYLEKHREQRYSYLKAWRKANPAKFQTQGKVKPLENKAGQKIAQETLKSTLNDDLKIRKISGSFSTFGLSELLNLC